MDLEGNYIQPPIINVNIFLWDGALESKTQSWEGRITKVSSFFLYWRLDDDFCVGIISLQMQTSCLSRK